MKTVMSSLQSFIRNEQGAAAVEYALLIALIAAVIFAALALLGLTVKDSYCAFLTAFKGSC